MSTIGKPERGTQTRVVTPFRDELGDHYVGDWSDRNGNSVSDTGAEIAALDAELAKTRILK